MQNTTLVIMAAGIGSRFDKGVKQLTKVGPSGELIVDYSIHDALEAGFNKVIFVIRDSILHEFNEVIGNRISKICDVEYAFQRITDLPDGYTMPAGRTKPWGTGQAVLSCKNLIAEPFAVINADDYYGKEAFVKVHDFLVDHANDKNQYCMPGFILENTLSEQGGVTRGVCQVNNEGFLTEIKETHDIIKKDDRFAAASDYPTSLPLHSLVSMNMWGVTPDYLDILETGFRDFLSNMQKDDLRCEYLLPVIMGNLLKNGSISVSVLKTHDKWFGLTYAEDKEKVVSAFRNLVDKGVYRTPLNS